MNLWGHCFSKNANQKLPRCLPYPLINFQGRNLGNFWLAFSEKQWPHKFILNLTDLYPVHCTANVFRCTFMIEFEPSEGTIDIFRRGRELEHCNLNKLLCTYKIRQQKNQLPAGLWGWDSLLIYVATYKLYLVNLQYELPIHSFRAWPEWKIFTYLIPRQAVDHTQKEWMLQ